MYSVGSTGFDDGCVNVSNQDINFFQQQDMLIRFRNMFLRPSFAASRCRTNIWYLT